MNTLDLQMQSVDCFNRGDYSSAFEMSFICYYAHFNRYLEEVDELRQIEQEYKLTPIWTRWTKRKKIRNTAQRVEMSKTILEKIDFIQDKALQELYSESKLRR